MIVFHKSDKIPYHPEYLEKVNDWTKWRLVYEAGSKFKNAYLQKYQRETNETYALRESVSYIPSFATAAIDEIKNGIIYRLNDVVRKGGNKTYKEANHNGFMAKEILPEFLPIGKLGIFVDRADLDPDISLYEAGQTSPYFYTYKAEEILNWEYDEYGLKSVLLQHSVFTRHELTQLPTGVSHEFRLFTRLDGKVKLTFFTDEFEPKSEKTLSLDVIPIVIEELPASLMKNIADHQIAMLNIGSNNVYYGLTNSAPFYVEQMSRLGNAEFTKPPQEYQTDAAIAKIKGTAETNTGEAGTLTIAGGTGIGRGYPYGANAPAFIAPPTEPLLALMQMYEKLKSEVRTLVNTGLATLNILGNIKNEGHESEEAGLAAIANYLENIENKIAFIWAKYEDQKEPAKVTYPSDFSLRSFQERIDEGKSLQATIDSVPSLLGKKAIAKKAVTTILYGISPKEQIDAIHAEIDQAVAIISDPKTLTADAEAGFIDTVASAAARCYPEGSAEKAKKEKEERLKAIAISQSVGQGAAAARGLPDADKQGAKDEKKESQSADNPKNDNAKAVRGEGK